MTVRPIPEGFHTLTPYLLVPHAARVAEFLGKVFGATEVHRSTAPDGRIVHAQLRVGDSMLMLSDVAGDWTPMPAMIHVYVEDVDAAYRRAIAAGATSIREPTDEYYGDRSAGVSDASGNQWWIATHVEDVPPAELRRREREALAQQA